ncbi:hypothetical protein YC2023_087646 [Brassica napus]
MDPSFGEASSTTSSRSIKKMRDTDHRPKPYFPFSSSSSSDPLSSTAEAAVYGQVLERHVESKPKNEPRKCSAVQRNQAVQRSKATSMGKWVAEIRKPRSREHVSGLVPLIQLKKLP